MIVNNEEMTIAIHNSQQVSLRDALEAVLLFDGSEGNASYLSADA